VAWSSERWADEEAAATCRRDTVADALAHEATSSGRMFATPAVVLAAAVLEAAHDTERLFEPAQRFGGR
jgi:hypothetical protein